jgi:lysophospholipase L1-like esterase
MRRGVRRLLFALAGVAGGLLAGDALVGLVARQPGIDVPRGMYVADPGTGYRLAPNFHGVLRTPTFAIDVRTNELGLRGPPLRDRGDGHRRVLLLGDSFVFGYAVAAREMIGALLERELSDESPGVEVLSAGAPGYGPVHELFLLRRLIGDVVPDVVVLGFFAGNDVIDALKLPLQQTVFRGVLVDHGIPERYAGAFGAARFESRQLLESTQLFRLLHQWEIRGVRGELLKNFSSDEAPLAVRAWTIVAQCLREMAATCAQSGSSLLAVAFPAQAQVDAPFRRRTFGELDLTPEQLLWPQKKLVAFAVEAALPCDDLTAAFEAKIGATPLYQPLDDHFNAAGNRLAAGLIAARLRELGWLAAPLRGSR